MFEYGPAYVCSKHFVTNYICQQKWENPIQVTESLNKQLNNCIMAFPSFNTLLKSLLMY